MKYMEDTQMESLLVRYYNGELSAEDIDKVETWMKAQGIVYRKDRFTMLELRLPPSGM